MGIICLISQYVLACSSSRHIFLWTPMLTKHLLWFHRKCIQDWDTQIENYLVPGWQRNWPVGNLYSLRQDHCSLEVLGFAEWKEKKKLLYCNVHDVSSFAVIAFMLKSLLFIPLKKQTCSGILFDHLLVSVFHRKKWDIICALVSVVELKELYWSY